MKVVFFNHFHNGDIHASRGLVRQIMQKLPEVSFEYSHRNPANLLSDIPNLTFSSYAINTVPNEHISLLRFGDTIYFNTWYAQQHFKHMNRYGITMDSLYAAFDENCRLTWGFSLEDLSKDPKVFFPSIDYSKFEIEHAQKWIKDNPGKKILVENGKALSGQAHDFNLTPIITRIASNHPNTTFIISNNDNVSLPSNCIYAANIIKKTTRSDLNEISFLSTHCDSIIGKASGPFTFALTQQNLFERNVKFICFSNLVPLPPNDFWINEFLRDKVKYSAKFTVSNESNPDQVIKTIEERI